jgi:signal transduction histidine kinase/ActR/RegA family two-component response regulator
MDFQRLADLSLDPLVAAEDGRVIYANVAAQRLFAADAGKHTLIGCTLDALWQPNPLQSAAREGEALMPTRVRACRLDGAHVDVEISAAWTGRSQVAIRLGEAAKSRFVAAVSHDLRQPMHALGLFIDDLKGAGLPPNAQLLVTQMESALHSTQLLLDSVLVMSRLEAGMVAPDLTSFPVQPMLDRLHANFDAAARKKGLRLRIPPSPGVVFSDVALLERIVSNLVSNALRYTDQGGVLLACRKRARGLLLQVWDTGLGIAAEHRQAIFDEFFRVERGKDNRGGVGLGLAIVRSCASLLGCTIELRSAPGRGSRFSLMVPWGQASAVASGPEPSEADDEQATDFAGLDVLVIDSDASILQGTRKLLERWGCDVTTAASGSEAEAALERAGRAPDLVISDLRLDESDLGCHVAMRLRRKYGAQLPVVLVSGDTSLQTARDVRRHGLTLLYKPLPPMRLRAIIAAALAAKPRDVSPGQTGPSSARQ